MIIDDASGRPVDYDDTDVTVRVDKTRKHTTKEELFAGRYLFVRKLGEGGMGKVLLMYDCVGRKDVAVKIPCGEAVETVRRAAAGSTGKKFNSWRKPSSCCIAMRRMCFNRGFPS